MSCFDDGQYTEDEGYPCECGGSITPDVHGNWFCDKCGTMFTKNGKRSVFDDIDQ